jgi:uncharacterized repeat protein (TIGR01451 family)
MTLSSSNGARRVLALLITLAVVLGAALATITAPLSANAATPGAGSPFDCTGNSIYSIDYQNGTNVYSVPTTQIGVDSSVPATIVTGTLANSSSRNGFAIVPGGTMAYYVATVGGGNYIYGYDPSGPTQSRLVPSPIAPPQGGAYDPRTGFYFFGNTGVGQAVYAYDPIRNTVIGSIGTLPANAVATGSGGGDYAFDNAGDFFWTNGGNLYTLSASAVPTSASAAALPSATHVSTSTLGNEPGIAFDPAGHLYEVTQGGIYNEVNPITGATSSQSQGSQGTDLSDMAGCDPPSSLTAQTSIADRTNSGDQFQLNIVPDGGSTASTTTSGSSTGLQNATIATVGVVGLGYTVSETAADGTDLADYSSSYECVDANHLGDDLGISGTGTSFTFPYPGGTDRRIVCTFTNVPLTADLTLTKTLAGARVNANDQFTVAVRSGSATGSVLNATAASTTSGSGSTVTAGTGTTGSTSVIATRSYYLTEQMAAGSASVLAQYQSTITCVDSAGLQSGLPVDAAFTGALAIAPVPGADIACTLQNAQAASSIALQAKLGSSRFDGGDQFTVALRTGSPTGPVVNPTTDSTTGGTGSATTGGTTGIVTTSSGTPYYLTETASADGGRYLATITCTDANGYQQDLPTDAPFTGSLAIAPIAGADISCTVTNALAPASLSLAKSNPAALTVGVPAQYLLTVSNDGGADSSTVVVVDQMPVGLDVTGLPDSDWSCTIAGTAAVGQLITCTSSSVPAGESSSFGITVVPQPEAAGTTAVNRASVGTPGAGAPVDPDSCTATGTPAGCAVTTGLVVGSGVALSLQKDNPPSLTVNVAASYTLTVINHGTGPAAGATVVDTLPAGLVYDSATGADCTAVGQQVSCAVPGPIPANGGSVAFTIVVTPTEILNGTDVANSATVDPTGGTAPGDPSQCTATDAPAGCAVTPPLLVDDAQLTLSKTATPLAPASSPVEVGDKLAYTFVVSNDSQATMTGITVDDPRLSGVVCAATSLAAGTSTTCSAAPYTVTQADVDAGAVTNTATASATLDGCASGCGLVSPEASAVSPTHSVGGLSATKTGVLDDRNGDGVANPGESIRYTVRLTNTGTVTLTGVTTSDPLETLSCDGSSIAPSASIDCVGSYTVTKADATAGSVRNTVTAGAVTPLGQKVTTTAATVNSAAPARDGLASTGLTFSWHTAAAGIMMIAAGAGLVLLVVLRRRRTL